MRNFLIFFPGMDAIRRNANRLRIGSVSVQTFKTRQKHWECYLRFCKLYNLPPVPCNLEQAACYLSYLSLFMKYSSILTYFYGVVFFHKLLGFVPPSASHFYLKSILSGIYREPSAPPSRKDPFRPADLVKLQRCVDFSSELELLTWVGIIVLFRSLLRVSHLVVSPHVLKRGDVRFKSWGVLLRINSSKSRSSRNPVYIPIVSSRNTKFCPVYWIRRLFSLFPKSLDSNLLSSRFCPRLTYSCFWKRLKTLCNRAQLKGNFSTHSLRRGGASALASLGIPVSDIKIRGLWASDCVFSYLSPSENRKKLVDSKLASLFA